MLKVVEKVWGREEWIVNNDLYCLKKLIVNPRGCCSLHAHRVKDESFYGIVGNLSLEIEGRVTRFRAGDVIRISPMTKHRFWVPPDGREAVFFEVSTHHEDTDVIRYEESKLL